MSCWHWQVGYIYTNILREICLHGINADLQKTAFLGFCDCGKEHDNDKELRGANFPDLLNFCLPSDDCKYQSSNFLLHYVCVWLYSDHTMAHMHRFRGVNGQFAYANWLLVFYKLHLFFVILHYICLCVAIIIKHTTEDLGGGPTRRTGMG